MLISEALEYLEYLKKEHGDIPILICHESEDGTLSTVIQFKCTHPPYSYEAGYHGVKGPVIVGVWD